MNQPANATDVHDFVSLAATSGAAVGFTGSERKITAALMDCVARWGLSKTTIDDVAKQAGVSRATVYRLFPGGKNAIMFAAVRCEVATLLDALSDELAEVATVEECLVRAMHHAASYLSDHPALSFMRDHERVAFEQVMSAERLDVMYVIAGAVLAPVFARFLDDQAADVASWAARIVVSYLFDPSDTVELTELDDVRTFVRTFMLPGIADARISLS